MLVKARNGSGVALKIFDVPFHNGIFYDSLQAMETHASDIAYDNNKKNGD